MARLSKAKGKLVKKYGVNIFGNPKYDKLLNKTSNNKRRGPRNGKKNISDYGKHLNEKQKVKFAYGLNERQFSNIFYKAKKMKGVTGINMLVLLERRIDNIVFRARFASTRAQARQIVNHGHVHLNGRRMNIPSATLKVGDVVNLKDIDRSKNMVRHNLSKNSNKTQPWLNIDEDQLKIELLNFPTRDLIDMEAQEQLIVEYYSRN